MNIQHVVVIGAGTMGGGIAAHCANSGLSVTLLDVAAPGPDKNAIVKALWERQLKLRPAPTFAPEVAQRVRLGNLEDDLERVRDADWVIEVIIEQLEPKQQLMGRIAPLLKPGAVVSTNTSGIPIHSISAGLDEGFRRRFLGTHFFNPPRYLKLLEVIPTADTGPDVVRAVTGFAESTLGKSVVVCKDTPNFIANRVGVFAGQCRTLAAIARGYSVEETDALTGPVIGNPRSGTFRLHDVVGLDVWLHVTRNLHALVPDDESRAMFEIPAVADRMAALKWLGNKTGQGFYKEVRDKDGSRAYWTLNLATLDYAPPAKPGFDVITSTRDMSLAARIREIFGNPRWETDRGGRYIIDTTLPILAYAARRVPEIADSPLDIDRAMRLGFASQAGPFELWDMIGLGHGIALMKARAIAVPAWVEALAASGVDSFYRSEDGQPVAVHGPAGELAVRRHRLEVAPAALAGTRRELRSNASASLLDLDDGVIGLEFHSKGNTLDTLSLDMIHAALETLEGERWRALVIANQGQDFSLGANLGMFIPAVADAAQTERLAAAMQQTVLALRFAAKPVVAAPRQRVLGGGAEIAMAGARMTASAETYMGLVEFGVGLIPALGGCKELLRRAVSPHMIGDKVDALEYLHKVFETVAFAKVSESATQCRDLGFLSPVDMIVANDERLAGVAKVVALSLADAGYRAPRRADTPIYALGSRGKAAMHMVIESLGWGGYASEHDRLIARKLAHVLAGGDLSAPAWVSEDYILDLEREAFLSLLGEPKTQARIGHMLKHAKPLRN